MAENTVEEFEGDEVEVIIDAELAGGRLDAVLAKVHSVLSRSRLKDLILAGAVTINGTTVSEPKYRVSAGETIVLIAPPPEDPEPKGENIPLDILYEDDQLIVINKPVGMVVHPAPGSPDGTLVNALIFHCGSSLQGIGGVKRPGIVHRLDRDTSGVMVAAKTEHAHKHLSDQFADHGRTGPLHRAYIAYVWGTTETAKGTVDAPLGRDQNNRFKQTVRKDGREAITHYMVEARFGDEGWDITRIQCQLETGRTHQIRVHMAHIGHPLVSDMVYASGFATKVNRLPEEVAAPIIALGRQALHAAELGFEHPTTGEEMMFEAPLPPDLEALDEALQGFDKAFAR
ncbi:pseudouridine synthase [Devosia limi DSM 17137]|uniref:Pseudouridine synthase n=1 Tax=Devosia limi DSM 17137 TaxID=1121477 RepID=A0A0F5LVL4_9HYPH|nr:RluA family pseudouridine synthase [Devosia limi]KKB86415.1 pseudouridine synthase [Devosia limi DSM 17137]SHE89757.1 23S rRNA pseudouridine1911/1915/1917 synthase [Devosia limi DSM 17137]